jgi:hypothetical protein
MNDTSVKELYTSNKKLNDTINKNHITNNEKLDSIFTKINDLEQKLLILTTQINSLINIEETELKEIKTNIINNIK